MSLTPRQNDVLRLLAEGLRDAEIAAELGVNVETVKTHLKKARRALGARNRAHAVALWLKSEGPD